MAIGLLLVTSVPARPETKRHTMPRIQSYGSLLHSMHLLPGRRTSDSVCRCSGGGLTSDEGILGHRSWETRAVLTPPEGSNAKGKNRHI